MREKFTSLFSKKTIGPWMLIILPICHRIYQLIDFSSNVEYVMQKWPKLEETTIFASSHPIAIELASIVLGFIWLTILVKSYSNGTQPDKKLKPIAAIKKRLLAQDEHLEEIREKILREFVDFHSVWIADSYIAVRLNIKPALASYHLTELHGLGLIDRLGPGLGDDSNEPTSQLSQTGRAYLVSRGLLK
jgi:hypothetical protein